MDSSADRAVAIVGVGAILPDAPNAPAFWQNIMGKRYSIIEVPPERWSVNDYFDTDMNAPDKTYTKIGGWVRDFEFDWRRFRIPPKVVNAMDEGQQWALTIAAEALDDYGYPARPLDTERTAVIIGTAMGGERHYETSLRVAFPEYVRMLRAVPEFQALSSQSQEALLQHWHAQMDAMLPPITEDSMPGELPNVMSGRVANVLNMRGPNFITDAACASSFAALNAAMEMLTEHHVDAVITGGVDRNMGVSTFVKFCKIGALSATGSRPFGQGADGFVMGEGAGVFLLKRLADAERNGDKIYAVIRGIGGSSDGKGKGITAPNPLGQRLAIQRGWENAMLDPVTATMVEAHGTSTRVGDVVEVESLNEVFGGAARSSIALGSAKSNIGHLKAGAGAAGLMKATLALYHKVLPPTLNAETPNPAIDFTKSPFYLNTEAREWAKPNGLPRRAGVSAYGFGGTNFHIVMEEHVPGLLTEKKTYPAAAVVNRMAESRPDFERPVAPIRGLLAIGANSAKDLKDKLDAVVSRVETGWTPPHALPGQVEISAPERIVIDFGSQEELLDRVHKAQKALGFDTPQAWKAFQAQGIFRGSGNKPGRIAYLFPGQGSQYLGMGSELAAISPVVQQVFDEADAVMSPILGRPLTDYIFVDDVNDPVAQTALMQTEITQPAMLTLDIALYRLLEHYGFKPDMVMGHSLGEYAALIVSGIMSFKDALEAAAARGSEMSRVSVEDNGWMAAVLAPIDIVEATLQEVDGYVVPANINSNSQCVIGGASKAVEQAIAKFEEKGYRAIQLPVSHAFHTEIVAPASGPLRNVLDRLDIRPPSLPLVANVTGDIYPTDVTSIKEILQRQIASPVQWVSGLETLYDHGVRTFIEVGPKRALRGFVNDVFDGRDVIGLITNHPKTGELAAFNQALAGLYAYGYYESPQPEAVPVNTQATQAAPVTTAPPPPTGQSVTEATMAPTESSASLDALTRVLAQALQQGGQTSTGTRAYNRDDVPLGSVVVTGTGLGLPGAEKPVMDPDNARRILQGEQFIDLIPERFRKKMLAKRITRLVKNEDGSGEFVTITDPDAVIRLAGRPGAFDLHEEYGVPRKLIEALDATTQLAMAAGLDALREAGIPLVQTYRTASTGKELPDRLMLPESLRDETGVIFGSAFPGGDRFVDELNRYYTYQNRLEQLSTLEDLRRFTNDPATLNEIARREADLREALEREAYSFDRRFIFRILAMGHSQFAEYIGARGPNTHVNAACASTTQGIAIAEDWIRTGRCRRVIVLGADDVTSDTLMEWIGAGFLATGAAATDDRVDEAALPFDRRRHGTLLGMGACALVVESEDAVRERGMRGIVEVLSTETRNSAFHGTRLDVNHISGVMDALVTSAERRFGVHRHAMAGQTVFISHETFTPARGGSAAAEVKALRHTFGESANDIIVCNTKGFTGHPMGVGIEDVIGVKILEHGIVPPVPNYKEVDPDLGTLNLSRGGRYPVQYALHLSAGFGSQLALTLTRRIPGALDRVDTPAQYQRWLDEVSGYNGTQLEIVKRVLRVQSTGAPERPAAASRWQYGTGPAMRASGAGSDAAVMTQPTRASAPPAPATYTPAPQPASVPRAPQVEAPPAPAPVPASTPAPEPVSPPVPQPPAPPASPAPPAAPAIDALTDSVLKMVAEQTGYPEDMLELDLDLEADLGVDTVKQAEIFAAVREAYDIPRRDDLRLRDYPTLGHVIGFVKEMRPDLAASSAPAPVAPPAVPASPAAASVVDDLSNRVLGIVTEQTGYPEDMLELDLDLEADLGVDTVKQAEIFAAIRESFDIPRLDNLKLRDYPTLGHVIGFVKEMRPDLAASSAPAPVAPPAVPASPAAALVVDDLSNRVLGIVTEQTGYPEDMLELDLDLEADLGVDTVKQAEIFAAIRESFDIPRLDDLKLRDYPTLGHVIGFVKEMRPDLVGPVASSAPPLAEAVSPAAPVGDDLSNRVLGIVTEQTGYPEDMLELDLDLEADLGVDTVKQAEIFAAIRESFDIPRLDDLKLRDYPTLGHVIGFVKEMRPDLVAPVASSAPPLAEAVSPAAPVVDDLSNRVLGIVTEQTGYPEDMLELDLDLEADLGVDTVKQAEIFAAIRESFDIPRLDDLKLRDYPTLGHVIGFVKEMRPDLGAGTAAPTASAPTAQGALVTQAPVAPVAAVLADADKVPRRVATPIRRPALNQCKPTDVTLDGNSRVIVAMDEGGVGKALVGRLEKFGVTVLTLEASISHEELEAQLAGWMSEGAIQGVYWLPALDVEPALEAMEIDTWRELNRQRVKNLYVTMRTLYDLVDKPGTFLLSATRLGGMHGYNREGATAPLGGAVTGFTKAYKRERDDVLVKAVDFEVSRKTAAYADLLVAETLTDPGVVEIGYVEDDRYAVTLVEQPAVDGQRGLELSSDTVFVVTGAAGGITSAIVGDLAAASSGVFYLLDLAEAGAAEDEDIVLFRQDREALRRKYIDAARAAGERPRMPEIDRQVMAVERRESALRAIEAVEQAQGRAIYRSVNLLDHEAVTAIIGEIREQHGRIDVLVHAGGLEISRTLPDKDYDQFSLVFDVKANGFFSMIKAAEGMPIGATVAFSSVAGRFGNNGQTDYSAANDLLCKISSSMRNWRPETRGIAIDWTAWGGIGMATRGSIPRIMEMAGIDMLPPEAGIPTVRRELVAGGFKGEIVVGQRLGILGAEWDETGGLDPELATEEAASMDPSSLVLEAGRVTAEKLYGGVQVERAFDPRSQAFLYDHQMDETPVLPGVMGVQSFAEVARLYGADWSVQEVRNVIYEAPFKFYRMEPQTLYLSGAASPEGDRLVVRSALHSRRELPTGLQEKLHFTGEVVLGTTAPESPASAFTAPDASELDITAEAIYQVYFHGPAYQVLERAQVTGDRAIALMADGLPPNSDPDGRDAPMAPRLIEFCFQTAGVWEIHTRKRMALPASLESVVTYRLPQEAEGKRLYCVVSAREDGDRFDAQVVDENGAVYVVLTGYRTVALPGEVSL